MLYAEQGMDANDIARFINAKRELVEEWITTGEWIKLRCAKNLSPTRLIQLYYEQSEAIMRHASDNTRPLTLQETNTLAKLADCIQKIEKRLDSGAVMDMLKSFNNYLVKVKPQLARELVHHELDYVRLLLREGK